MDVSARFADLDEVKKLEDRGYQSIPSDTGRLIIPADGVRLSETVRLGAVRFLWSTKITVKGISFEG